MLCSADCCQRLTIECAEHCGVAFRADTGTSGCAVNCIVSTLLDALARERELMILRRPSLLVLVLPRCFLLSLLLLRLHDASFQEELEKEL
jgi:hypothetical protein